KAALADRSELTQTAFLAFSPIWTTESNRNHPNLYLLLIILAALTAVVIVRSAQTLELIGHSDTLNSVITSNKASLVDYLILLVLLLLLSQKPPHESLLLLA